MEDEIRIEKPKIRIRKTWPSGNDFKPETKIEKVKTDYQRQNNKKFIDETIQQEQLDNDNSDLDWLP